ncbi:MAG: CBS domain-containing protein [Bacillota bacterium]
MKIRDIMTDEVAYVSPETMVVEAARLMQKHDVGAIPVCTQDGVVGIVTDRDIIVRNIAHGKDPHTTPVKDVMTSKVESVSPEMSVGDAAELMSARQIRRLPVVENDRLVGIVSVGDLAMGGIADMEVGQMLADISFPAKPEKI